MPEKGFGGAFDLGEGGAELVERAGRGRGGQAAEDLAGFFGGGGDAIEEVHGSECRSSRRIGGLVSRFPSEIVRNSARGG
ncbi:hypothetical protein GCM10022380_74820 [Amycolatopsis tucumanensis]|uniref:Uncharacterized protein n=1 Tax=Amycolatopsis tucumanensis TaxID=401106 RepID=A0ABP7JIB2_9PSEU